AAHQPPCACEACRQAGTCWRAGSWARSWEYSAMTLDARVLLVIAGMGLLTYMTRVGGVWLAGRVARAERLESWLAPAPGAILSAVVAPAVLTAGWQGVI